MDSPSIAKILSYFSFLAAVSFFTCAHAYTQVRVPAHEVTATQYADFLNQNAASDPDYLFDDKMATDPKESCIVRMGTLGQWHYEVIAGRENFPVMYVNEVAKQTYCDWLQNGAFVDEPVASDPYLKSNQNKFFVDGSQVSQLLVLGLGSGAPEQVNSKNVIEALVALVAAVAAGEAYREFCPSFPAEAEERAATPQSPTRLDLQDRVEEKSNPMTVGSSFIPIEEVCTDSSLGYYEPLNLRYDEHGEFGHLRETPVEMTLSSHQKEPDHQESVQNFISYLGDEYYYLFEKYLEQAKQEGVTQYIIQQVLSERCALLLQYDPEEFPQQYEDPEDPMM